MTWFVIFLALFAFRAFGLCAVVLYGSFSPCKENQVYFDGFQIRIGAGVRNLLTSDELVSVLQHENGHRVHWHVWKNFVRALFFFPHTQARRLFQEQQADRCVTNKRTFVSALKKLGVISEIDRQRLKDYA